MPCLLTTCRNNTGQLHAGALLSTCPANMSQLCWYGRLAPSLAVSFSTLSSFLPPPLSHNSRARSFRLLQRHDFPPHHQGRWEKVAVCIAGYEAGKSDMTGYVPILHTILPSLPPSLLSPIPTGFYDPGWRSHRNRTWRGVDLRVSAFGQGMVRD